MTSLLRLIPSFAAIGCILLASCYPYNESPKSKRGSKTPPPSTTATDPAKPKEPGTQAPSDGPNTPTDPNSTTTTNNTPPAPDNTDKPTAPTPPKRDYPIGTKVVGQDGFVLSPYNSKKIDVRDIPSGTLVQDPTYPAAEKKYFRVP